MKCSIRKFYNKALISVLAILIFTNFYPVMAIPFQSSSSPALYVDPPTYTAKHFGETFNITVKIANVTATLHMIGVEFKLRYDKAILQTREEWFTEGNFFKAIGETFSKVIIGTDDEGQGYVHALVLLLPSIDGNYSRFPQGEGTIATLTFNASYRPIEPLQASCELKLFDTILVDSDVNTIPHTIVNGMYQIVSLKRPVLEVLPKTFTAYRKGETFEVNVNIGNADSDWRLVGLQFKLQYDTSILETKPEWVVEGDFFKSYGSTWFQAFVEHDYALVGTMVLPPQTSTWHEPFPEGNGTIATLTFNASYRPIEPLQASCELKLFDTILVDSDVNTIPHTIVNGMYQIVSLKRPVLEVLPKTFTAYRKGETFEVNVNIKDVDKDLRLVGLQFKLQYDTSILETKPEWVVEGDFFKSYGSTWFQAFVENNYGIIGIMILPDQNGTWHEPFPEGSGTIATLTFKTIYQPVVPSDSSSCILTLKDTILVDDNNEQIPHTASDGEFVIVPASAGLDQYRPIDLQVDVGAIHFNGEIADFYVLVTDYGKVVDADNIRAMLYTKGAEYMDLTANIEHVAKGLYRIPYTIPVSAQPGTYALLVQAEYLQVNGSALRSFLISSTLSNWNTYISEIKDNIATVIIPTMGQIRLDLKAINATLVSIGDKTATIQTSVGDLKTSLEAINATLVSIGDKTATIQTSVGNLTTSLASINTKIVKIDGDIATVQTDLGTIKTKVADLPGSVQTSINLLYVAVMLALIAAIASVLTFLNSRKKHI